MTTSIYRAGLTGEPIPAAIGARMIASGLARGRSAGDVYKIGTGKIVVGGVGNDFISLLMTIAHVILICAGLNILIKTF